MKDVSKPIKYIFSIKTFSISFLFFNYKKITPPINGTKLKLLLNFQNNLSSFFLKGDSTVDKKVFQKHEHVIKNSNILFCRCYLQENNRVKNIQYRNFHSVA